VTHLLDTDTCIHLLRGLDAAVRHAQEHRPTDLAVSAITEYELLYGVERCPPSWRKAEGRKVKLFLDQFHILPFTAGAAAHAANVRISLETRRRSMGPMDVLIAATALEYLLPIVTGNLAEFQRVPDLRCLTWSV
jgi:tRNA(fMet)-specific endonuclease VapC